MQKQITDNADILKVLELLLTELKSAQKKHPIWPEDKIHAAAVIVEESGELTQAANDYIYGQDKGVAYGNMIKEASQVGATAIRFLLNTIELKKI